MKIKKKNQDEADPVRFRNRNHGFARSLLIIMVSTVGSFLSQLHHGYVEEAS